MAKPTTSTPSHVAWPQQKKLVRAMCGIHELLMPSDAHVREHFTVYLHSAVNRYHPADFYPLDQQEDA